MLFHVKIYQRPVKQTEVALKDCQPTVAGRSASASPGIARAKIQQPGKHVILRVTRVQRATLRYILIDSNCMALDKPQKQFSFSWFVLLRPPGYSPSLSSLCHPQAADRVFIGNAPPWSSQICSWRIRVWDWISVSFPKGWALSSLTGRPRWEYKDFDLQVLVPLFSSLSFGNRVSLFRPQNGKRP